MLCERDWERDWVWLLDCERDCEPDMLCDCVCERDCDMLCDSLLDCGVHELEHVVLASVLVVVIRMSLTKYDVLAFPAPLSARCTVCCPCVIIRDAKLPPVTNTTVLASYSLAYAEKASGCNRPVVASDALPSSVTVMLCRFATGPLTTNVICIVSPVSRVPVQNVFRSVT
jgi:hypothetical protein